MALQIVVLGTCHVARVGPGIGVVVGVAIGINSTWTQFLE